jgi:exosome complex component RRP45
MASHLGNHVLSWRRVRSMAIREGKCQSLNTSAFVLESLQRGRRIDGRVLTAMRSLRFTFTRAEGQASAEVQLGRTRALAVVSSEVVPPYPDRPADGLLSFSVELSKMAEASIGAQRSPPIAAEIVRIIERGVRDSQALVSA